MIPLTQPSFGAGETEAIAEVLHSGVLSGDGVNCRRAEAMLREICGVAHALLTTSCSHALELAMMALELQPGDEVIMPSFTFTSTANAVALRGARPVFVDIEADGWNLDPAAVEAALSPRTRGILPVHYAGQGCDMRALAAIAERHQLWIVEDAAQGVGASVDGKPLGAWGQFGCVSFHQTKNIVCGEGGALLTNDPRLARRAEILREKGTNRAAFLRGEVDKYTWIDVGSSYVLSELNASVLRVQLAKLLPLTTARQQRWARYHEALEPLERAGKLQRPRIHGRAHSNWHSYGILVDSTVRDDLLRRLRAANIGATFHFVPLHTAPAAERYGAPPHLPVTDRVAGSLIRLPLFATLAEADQGLVIEALTRELG